MYPELSIRNLFILKGYPAPINSINSLLNTEIGHILLTKKKKKNSVFGKRCFQKKSFSKRIGMFRLLTKKNELELNDPLSNFLVA